LLFVIFVPRSLRFFFLIPFPLLTRAGETPIFCGTVKGYVNVLLRILLLGGIDVDSVIELYGGTALHGMYWDEVSMDWEMTR
jgi:hypothetical protein